MDFSTNLNNLLLSSSHHFPTSDECSANKEDKYEAKDDLNNFSNEMEKLNKINSKSVELINEDKIEGSLNLLKKAEETLESYALESNIRLDKKVLIIVIHNIACCYQKSKEYENCVSYLDAVVYHYDGMLENKYNIDLGVNSLNLNPTFDKENMEIYSDQNLFGDMILQLRFSAKFHLQMCAVLSQANNHSEALNHAKIAASLCEDNIIKTSHLLKLIFLDENCITNSENNDFALNKKTRQDTETIITSLTNKINRFKENIDTIKGEWNSEFRDYADLETLKASCKNVLASKGSDDWVNFLNIGNIMYLSPIHFDELDLESDPKFELLRDAIIEKVYLK